MSRLPFTPSAQRMANRLRRRAHVLTVVLSIPATLLVAATPASAFAYPGYDGDFNTNGVNIRTAPYRSATIVGNGYIGHRANVHDKTGFGDWVNCGSWSTTAWDYVTDDTTGVTGWVSDCYVDSDSPMPTFPM